MPPESVPAVVLPQGLRQTLELGQRLARQRPAGRYAPSPTGPQHLGNLRTALLSWLVTRLQGGAWLLRIDDLDTPRNSPGAVAVIQEELIWLGLAWDGPPILQSRRRGLYASVLSALRRGGMLYPCRCSRRLLADISAPHGQSVVYPGTCRDRSLAWGPEQGRLPSWRLRQSAGAIHWPEALGADGACDAIAAVGDVVLRRADGFLAYHLATVVDEISLGITDVVRGADLHDATAPQVALMQCLGFGPPHYWHVPLWCDTTGQRLAKRRGGVGLAALQAEGWDGAAVVGHLAASLGLVPRGTRISADDLRAAITLEQLRGLLAERDLQGQVGQQDVLHWDDRKTDGNQAD